MVWSSAAQSAADAAAFAADYPCILAAHALRDGADELGQKWVRTNNYGGVDRTDAGPPAMPGKRTWDGLATPGLHCRPSLADSAYYLLYQSSGVLAAFDTLVLFPSAISDVDTITLNIADDGAHTTSAEVLSTSAPVYDYTRIAELELFHTGAASLIYSDVDNLSVGFVPPSGNITPHVREVWIGQRIQLQIWPREPWGDLREVSRAPVVSMRDNSRYIARVGARGRRELAVTFDLTSAAELAVARRIWDESRQGTEPLIWIDTPASSPAPYLMRIAGGDRVEYDPALEDGPHLRSLTWRLVEQKPYRALEEGS